MPNAAMPKPSWGYSRANAQRLLDTVQLYVAIGGVPLPAQAAKTGDAPQKACCDYD